MTQLLNRRRGFKSQLAQNCWGLSRSVRFFFFFQPFYSSWACSCIQVWLCNFLRGNWPGKSFEISQHKDFSPTLCTTYQKVVSQFLWSLVKYLSNHPARIWVKELFHFCEGENKYDCNRQNSTKEGRVKSKSSDFLGVSVWQRTAGWRIT